MFKIMIIEDDREINNVVKIALEKEKYIVNQIFHGDDFDKLIVSKYELVILDIMLPGIDGTEILRKIRETSNVPVIIISAKTDETDRIIGLGIGADDYMTKPFSIKELIARVKAQLRRYKDFNKPKTDNVIKYGELKIDINKFNLSKNGENIVLTPKEFMILKLFMTNKGRVFTKKQIFNNVWSDEFISDDNTVMVHIRRLRNKIEDNPDNPKYIITVWGIGYKLGDV